MHQFCKITYLRKDIGRIRLLCAFAGSVMFNHGVLAQDLVSPVHYVSSQTEQDIPNSLLPFSATDIPVEKKLVQNTTEHQKSTVKKNSASPAQPETGIAPEETIPNALTSPVLDNVPTALDKRQMSDPTRASSSPLAPMPQPSQQLLQVPQTDADPADTLPSEVNSNKRPGPRLKQSFSVLFTEQRPFLLYAQDTSISYLMPNALVEHPWISRTLRNTLELRALGKWQELRKQTSDIQGDTKNTNRPDLVISGRVEDRFSSDSFSSLFLMETTTKGSEKKPAEVLSFNFDHRTKQAFELRDLFEHQNEEILQATVSLIAAYLQADIVRQKSVRLGTPVTIDQDSWLKDLKPDLGLFRTFTLVPSKTTGKIAGLTFHFNPGLIGAKSDGVYEVYVPAAIFSGSLNTKFANEFEGDAMQVSRHNAAGFSSASINLDSWRDDMELGGDMLIEGEVPGNWCDGFHLTLVDNKSGQIVTEALVEMLPKLPPYGLAGNMMRFRAELPVTGSGGQTGQLIFEPYKVETSQGRILLRAQSSCDPDKAIIAPDPQRDSIAISVIY